MWFMTQARRKRLFVRDARNEGREKIILPLLLVSPFKLITRFALKRHARLALLSAAYILLHYSN